MAISSPGIGSGLDINGIIAKLMQVEQQPLMKLATKEASYQSKISAFGSLQGAVAALNSALATLVPAKTSAPVVTATIGNTAAALVSATATAQTGSYSFEVNQLATAHKIGSVSASQKLVSGQYASALSAISQGTLNLSVGGGAAVPITINAGNATLTGLKNAINAANAGVSADIVPDGGSVRLVLTSNTIGDAGKITTSGLANFDFNGITGSLSQDPLVGGRAAAGFNSASATIATGTLAIQVGNGAAVQVTINNGNNTLTGLKDAINSSGAGVTAELVNAGANDVRLVLTAKTTGAANTITTSGLDGFVSTGGAGSLSQSAAYGGQASQDAAIKLNGVSSSYSSNTITSALSGLTLRLTNTTETATTLKVARSEGATFAEQATAKFRSIKGVVGDNSATASATADAAPGSYSFQVMQLATYHRITTPGAQAHQLVTAAPQAQVVRSGSLVASTTDITDGTDGALQIAVGSSPAFTVDVTAGTTLDQLKDLINNDADNTGVTASVVNDGTGHRLSLTSNIAGDSGKLTITNSGGVSGFDYDAASNTGSMSQSQAAAGYSSSADSVAQGTLTLTMANGSTKDIVIDGSNNTLSGLKDAINAAGAGVTASIINSGTGVKLVIKSNTAGGNGTMTLSGLTGFEFNGTTKTLSDASADGGAAAQGFASAAAAVGTGTLQLKVDSGTVRNITIDSSNNTLEGVKDAINNGSYGVTATLVTAGTNDTRLVLTSNTIGTDGQISLSGIAGLGFDPGSGTGDFSQAAADGGQAALGSIIKLNGVTIAGKSNTITEALQGVTLNLTAVSTNATTLTVSQDKSSALNTSLSAIVKAYNDLNKTLRELGKYDEASKSGGPLIGNSTLRQVSSTIRNIFQSAPAELVNSPIKYLSDIGLEMEKDGSITFDASKLSAAAGSHYDSAALLAASFGKAAKALTDGMLGAKGTITSASDGLKSSIELLGDQRERMINRLQAIETRYKRQFTALDTLLSSMNATASQLQQQLANLPGSKSSSQ